MATRDDSEIIVVLPKNRRQLLERKEDVFVHSEDEDLWERPAQEEETWLINFLQDKYRGAPKRFWTVKVGVRIGYDEQGVFLHKNHLKRYFGLDKWEDSLDIEHAGSAVQTVCGVSGEACHAGKSDKFLNRLSGALSIHDDTYYQILRASFQKADNNGNGKLDHKELGFVFRRVLNTLKDSDIAHIMKEADTDGDGQVNYEEFAAYLQKTANSKVSKSFVTSLTKDIEADMVRATFRLWDTDGHGVIPNKELINTLMMLNPSFTKTQANALVNTIDADHDGNVDYDEFVDFLFHRPARPATVG